MTEASPFRSLVPRSRNGPASNGLDRLGPGKTFISAYALASASIHASPCPSLDFADSPTCKNKRVQQR